jgi:argininosuccinate lyase
VRVAGLPFRVAHEVTGRIVAHAEAAGLSLEQVPLADLQKIEPRITRDVFSVLGTRASVESRASSGGTAPGNVRRAAGQWLGSLSGAKRD